MPASNKPVTESYLALSTTVRHTHTRTHTQREPGGPAHLIANHSKELPVFVVGLRGCHAGQQIRSGPWEIKDEPIPFWRSLSGGQGGRTESAMRYVGC